MFWACACKIVGDAWCFYGLEGRRRFEKVTDGSINLLFFILLLCLPLVNKADQIDILCPVNSVSNIVLIFYYADA